MIGSPIIKPHFSGHETFALRYGWLKMAVDGIENPVNLSNKNLFRADEAISIFGVGRNMATSMRHWALATDIIRFNKTEGFTIGPLGKFLFSESNGVDPYLENPDSLWLLHWRLTNQHRRSTTWHFGFHHFTHRTFDRDTCVAEVKSFCRELDHDVAHKTVRRDVDCFVNSYVLSRSKSGQISEDSLVCPFTELRLIGETARRGVFEFRIGSKPTLSDGLFQFALREFAENQIEGRTLSLEQITYDPGSPGRAFKLDENSVTDRLVDIEQSSDGIFAWTETAGLRQVQLLKPDVSADEVLLRAFFAVTKAEAA